MDWNWTLALAACGVGIVVGLTGMGGGALMTPVLVLFFNIPPLTAVSSDLVSAAVMKPVGSFVHFRRGTVQPQAGRLAVHRLGAGGVLRRARRPGARQGRARPERHPDRARHRPARRRLRPHPRGRTCACWSGPAHRDGRAAPLPQGRPRVTVRPLPTVAVGAVGGFLVGMTSVGSGSLIIIALMALYPGLRASELVGTDLVQAVPLVWSAAFGHLLFGDFQFSVTLPLLVGSIPGVYVGAQLSSRLPGGLIRRALAFVLLASALKLFDVSTRTTGVVLIVSLLLAPPVWWLARKRQGLPARPAGLLTRRRTPAGRSPPNRSAPNRSAPAVPNRATEPDRSARRTTSQPQRHQMVTLGLTRSGVRRRRPSW